MSTYTAAECKAYGKKLAKSRATTRELTRVAAVIAQSRASEGVSESELARELGVNRTTIRKWLGK